MIRPFTCLCLAAACGSGLYLYSEKHRTAMLDRDISNVIHQTEAARARIGLLRAEWALLNEPGRLQDMADKYLALKPMAPTQFVQLSDLPNHLPPPLAAGAVSADGTDEDGDGAAPQVVAQTPAETQAGTGTPDAKASDAAAGPTVEAVLPAKHTADPTGDALGAPKLLAKADIKPKPVHHAGLSDRAYAPPHDGLMTQGMPLPLAAPQPVGARVYSALAQKLPPATHRPVVAATPRYVAPYVASALAGRASLPPPTPYGGDQ
jgi:hypothetical protein